MSDSVKCSTTQWQLIFKTSNQTVYANIYLYMAWKCCFTFSAFYDLLRDDDPVSILLSTKPLMSPGSLALT